MNDNQLQPRQSLNKAFLKVKPDRSTMEKFRANLLLLLDRMNETESEEFHKNLVSDFLKNTYYSPNYFINTKERNDLVIHNGKDAKSTVGVILEAKKPRNKQEMLKVDNLNTKAFQELVLYFLRERITKENLEIRYLVATNIYEWFIFDANEFEKYFAANNELVKQFKDFEAGRLSGTKTDFFYREIAKLAIANIAQEIKFTYFDLRDFTEILRNADGQDENQLIPLFKIFSPEHLLKLPFINDSNTLNKAFYSELLYIIGLMETKEGGKKLIGRKKEGDRHPGSLIENVISQLDSYQISQLEKPEQYGETDQDRFFNIGLELAITWINRVLFLKLLEAQLIKYNDDKSFKFLSGEKIQNYGDLNRLFFNVLALKQGDRRGKAKELFTKVPYLNSSLFEKTYLEGATVVINDLEDEILPIFPSSVLKDNQGKRRTGDIPALIYLFEFLDAYDFSSEGVEEIQEESKSPINAAVLGLIFEKINGYKDGSFFTPGFITMYMCRETIRRAVVQKFNEAKGWSCQNISDLKEDLNNYIKGSSARRESRNEANEIINSLKICDPAVGSGHFLVSALNEIIAIKQYLGILQDSQGETLSQYEIEVDNDELSITYGNKVFFNYNPQNKESQRVQETLFHEKQTIIENCLFGVDINPNSVKICQLRLWIELLKNAYYKENGELETLPNIDINIKCGNSLISRFALDADLSQALTRNKHSIESYRNNVQTYRNAEDKNQKREMEQAINAVKQGFFVWLDNNDPNKKKLLKLHQELSHESLPTFLEESAAVKKAREKKITKLQNEIDKLTAKIEDIESGKVYENALEWRFEFPEVLNDDGDFVGFDVVIGNPPYLSIEDITWDYRRFYETIYSTATGRFDLYSVFIEKSLHIKSDVGVFTFIVPGKFLNNKQFMTARKMICQNRDVVVVKIDDKVFDEAQVNSLIIKSYLPKQLIAKYKVWQLSSQEIKFLSETNTETVLQDRDVIFRLQINTQFNEIISKIESNSLRIKEICDVKDGIVAGVIKDILFLEQPIDDYSKKLYFGKHLSRYTLLESNIWINYKPNEMMQQEIERKNGKRSGLWMRDKKIFEREKILSRFVAQEIIATYDNQNRYYEHTLHSTYIQDKRFKTKYILGLYNSALLKFYYQKTNSQGGNIFPQVRISALGNLPIKIATIEFQDLIEKLVDQILTAKEDDLNTDTTPLEKEIDRLVYKLYQLTYEEVKIIDPEFELTEQEYTAIQME